MRNNEIFTRKWAKVLETEHLPNGSQVFLARDRSESRSHILVIDHYIPQPDRDAGSRTLDHYLRLFQVSGLQTKFWPHNRSYDRIYAQPLQRLGIEVLYSLEFLNIFDEWLDDNGHHLKYVLLSRADIATEYVDKIRTKTCAKILFYGHDVHFHRLEMEYLVTRNPAIKAEADSSAKMERAIWSKCDVLYYPSEDEQKIVSAEVPSKVVRAIPPFIYDNSRLNSTRERLIARKIAATGQVMFIGGFRHRPNVDAMIWFVKDIWPGVISQVPHAYLCIAGSFPPPEIEALAGPNIVVTGPISDDVLGQLYRSSQVAIVPLRFGAGVKGKAFEAMGYGVPIVTTHVGVQGMNDAEKLVSVCDSAEAFGAAVVEILEKPNSHLDQVLSALNYIGENASSGAARNVFSLDVPEIGG